MKRATDVMRMQSVSLPTLVGWPVGIALLVLGLNIAVASLVQNQAPETSNVTGAILAIYFVMLATHLQAVTQYFPFAVGMGVTRREFMIGTGLLVAAQAAVFGALNTALLALERASDGWWVGLDMYGLSYLVQSNVLLQWLAFTLPFFAFSAVGMFFGVITKRWGLTGIYTLSVVSAVLAVGIIYLLTWRSWWDDLGRLLADASPLVILLGLPIAITVVLSTASYGVFRRAVP